MENFLVKHRSCCWLVLEWDDRSEESKRTLIPHAFGADTGDYTQSYLLALLDVLRRVEQHTSTAA
jgi:hypothetical protein